MKHGVDHALPTLDQRLSLTVHCLRLRVKGGEGVLVLGVKGAGMVREVMGFVCGSVLQSESQARHDTSQILQVLSRGWGEGGRHSVAVR